MSKRISKEKCVVLKKISLHQKNCKAFFGFFCVVNIIFMLFLLLHNEIANALSSYFIYCCNEYISCKLENSLQLTDNPSQRSSARAFAPTAKVQWCDPRSG